MNGNVYEWVADSWHPDYKGAPRDATPWLDRTAAEFVSRGGSFQEVGSSLTSFARSWGGPNPAADIGFRLVVEDKGKAGEKTPAPKAGPKAGVKAGGTKGTSSKPK